MTTERVNIPGVLSEVPLRACDDCQEHQEVRARVIDLRRASEARDRQDGEIMAELADHRKKLVALDARLDTITEQHAQLATSMASSASIARTGGLFAGGGGALMAGFEIGKNLGHALGWW
jgi:hypothetical protein